jgi:predicted  nucleic acid-binding Zn-ribbon protein
VATLYELQEFDLAIDSANATLADVEERLRHDEELVAARENVKRLEEELSRIRQQQRDIDLDAEKIRERVKATETKLYGGSVRNPRELEDLQQDVQALTHQLRGREDEVLSLMMRAEELDGELQQARKNLADVEKVRNEEQEKLHAQQTAIQSELTSLEGQRSSQLTLIDPTALGLYSSLRERRQGRAVARVQQGMCQGCRIALPMTVLQRARPGIELVQCPSCERILYVN